ncbi:MAG: energy-coupling factor transporter transmembrane protein EcfT [Firmicutes bacterium]|nr:energy-coupling factor transporter transmembrane protein EcfT [Bacillota bacterium]
MRPRKLLWRFSGGKRGLVPVATFRHITIGQYIPGESLLHRLDPRTKILVTLLLVVGLFFIDTYLGYGLAALYIALAIFRSGIPPRFLFRGLRPVIIIILLTFMLNSFMTEGEILWQWGFLTLTKEGLSKGGMLAIRLILLIVGTSILTLTTSPLALTDGLESLLRPGKRIGIPAHELAMMMTIALRFIPTLLEETEKIMKAQMARGADFESGNLLQRARSLLPLLVPLFVSAFRRADDLAVAMEARCYRGGEGRTKLKQLAFHTTDFLVLVGSSFFVLWLAFSM